MHRELPGWSTFFENGFQPFALKGFRAARVTQEHRNQYIIISDEGEEIPAEPTGAFRHRAADRSELPTVGDFVAVQISDGRAAIHAVLPRHSLFSRKAPGAATVQQTVAANIDTVLLVTGLDDNFNLRRIERYLVSAWESGAKPVIVLNKADLCDNLAERIAETEAVAFGTPVVAMSTVTGEGVQELIAQIAPGTTAALLGSSGVGKSSIVNALADQQLQRTSATSESVGKGRHTTTSRELRVLPSGIIVIDTPGMRELGLWSEGEGLEETFDDVEALARSCRFRDCMHNDEPGCAVCEAVANGTLTKQRLRSYLKLQRELAYFRDRHDGAAEREKKQRWKQIHKQMRSVPKKGQ